MKKNRKILVIGALIVGFNGPAHSEDLLNIYQLAQLNDPTYLRAEANLKIEEENLPQSTADFLPSFDFGASVSKNRYVNNDFVDNPNISTDSGTTDSNSSRYSVNLSQPIYNRAYPIKRSRIKSFIAQAEAQFRDAKQTLILSVAQRYFEILSAIDDNEFAKADLEAIGRQLEQSKQRFDVGLVAITDVHEAQAAYDSAVARNISAQNAVDSAFEKLRLLTGQYHRELAHLNKQSPLEPPAPNDIDHWTRLALDENITIQATRHYLESNREFIRLQRAQHFPTLTLSASIGNTKGTNELTLLDTDSTSSSASLNFNLPIFSGGRISSSVRQAEYQYSAALQDMEFQIRTSQRDVRNSFLNVSADVSRIKALEQAVVSNESALKATEAGFEVGTRTTVDVLNARTNLLQAKVNLSRARYTYIQNRLLLQQAAGQLGDDDIAEINSWLQQ